MSFGLLPEGLVIKRIEDIRTEIQESIQGKLGNEINLLPETVLGQLVDIFADRESTLWELLEAIFNSQYPDTALNTQLDQVAALVGVVRKVALKSTVQGQLLFGTIGTVIPIGTIFSVQNAETSTFLTDAAVTLVAGVDEIQKLSFSATPTSGVFRLTFRGQETADIAFDDSASAVQSALEALSSIGAGNVSVTGSITLATGLTITYLNVGPTGLGSRDIEIIAVSINTLDAGGAVTITPSTTTEGVPQGEVNMSAQITGPIVAPAFSLTVIDTPVTGLDTTVNPVDAIVGRNVETDTELKIRRELELQKAGAATVEAIRADILSLVNIIAVIVFQNNSDLVDPEGRPAHSVDIVVQGGDEDEIATSIFETVAAGIETIGTITKIVIDSQGFSQTIKFSRPTEVDIHVEVDLVTDSNIFPLNGAATVESNILAFGDNLQIGDDVITIPDLLCAIPGKTTGIPGLTPVEGITDITIRIGTAPSPTLDDNIDIEARELADFDSARITIVVT